MKAFLKRNNIWTLNDHLCIAVETVPTICRLKLLFLFVIKSQECDLVHRRLIKTGHTTNIAVQSLEWISQSYTPKSKITFSCDKVKFPWVEFKRGEGNLEMWKDVNSTLRLSRQVEIEINYQSMLGTDSQELFNGFKK